MEVPQVAHRYWSNIGVIFSQYQNVVVTANFRQHITDIGSILSNWCLPILAIQYPPNIVPICVTIVPGFRIISELNNTLYSDIATTMSATDKIFVKLLLSLTWTSMLLLTNGLRSSCT